MNRDSNIGVLPVSRAGKGVAPCTFGNLRARRAQHMHVGAQRCGDNKGIRILRGIVAVEVDIRSLHPWARRRKLYCECRAHACGDRGR